MWTCLTKAFMYSYEHPESNVDMFAKEKEKNWNKNTHIFRRIIHAILICCEQGLALLGHRDHHQHKEDDDKKYCAATQGNFLAIFMDLLNMIQFLKNI